jgi:hypothetical protein
MIFYWNEIYQHQQDEYYFPKWKWSGGIGTCPENIPFISARLSNRIITQLLIYFIQLTIHLIDGFNDFFSCPIQLRTRLAICKTIIWTGPIWLLHHGWTWINPFEDSLSSELHSLLSFKLTIIFIFLKRCLFRSSLMNPINNFKTQKKRHK